MEAFFNSMPNAFGQGLCWGIMAIGVYITYRILDIADLTVDGSLATGGAVCAIAITIFKLDPWVALLLAMIAGMAAGLLTGLFHTVCGIPAILSGILTQLALYSLNLRILAIGIDAPTNANVSLQSRFSDYKVLISSLYIREFSFTDGAILKNPLVLLVVIVAVVIGILYWLFGTELGSGLRATGANANMARAQGINTNLGKVLGLAISNGLVAVSGALLAQYSGGASVDMGKGAIVIGLAAIIIGEVLLEKVFRNFALKLTTCVIGAIMYYIVITFVLRLGLESSDLNLLTALVVALFLAVPYWKGKYFKKRVKGGALHAGH